MHNVHKWVLHPVHEESRPAMLDFSRFWSSFMRSPVRKYEHKNNSNFETWISRKLQHLTWNFHNHLQEIDVEHHIPVSNLQQHEEFTRNKRTFPGPSSRYFVDEPKFRKKSSDSLLIAANINVYTKMSCWWAWNQTETNKKRRKTHETDKNSFFSSFSWPDFVAFTLRYCLQGRKSAVIKELCILMNQKDIQGIRSPHKGQRHKHDWKHHMHSSVSKSSERRNQAKDKMKKNIKCKQNTSSMRRCRNFLKQYGSIV